MSLLLDVCLQPFVVRVDLWLDITCNFLNFLHELVHQHVSVSMEYICFLSEALKQLEAYLNSFLPKSKTK